MLTNANTNNFITLMNVIVYYTHWINEETNI